MCRGSAAQLKILSSSFQGYNCGEGPVDVPVVLRNEVDVVEYDAVPVVIVHRLREADVEEHGSVEGVEISLVDEIDLVVEILLPGE